MEMKSTLGDEQQDATEEKKCGIVSGSAGRLKQLYDKTNMAKDKYDKVKSRYDNVNNARNKAQPGSEWFKSDEVHPISSNAKLLSMQVAMNMGPQNATVLGA
jgi:hypothetical protein